MIGLSAEAELQLKGEFTMNTDKIYAEAIANEYFKGYRFEEAG